MDTNVAVHSMREDPAVFVDSRVIENILQQDSKYLPSAGYFNDVQLDVKPNMRKILLSWMLEVLEEQSCDQDVFFLAVNYVDRFLSTTCISRDDLQLVGSAAMFIASKLREPRPLAADTLVMYTDNSIELQQLMMMEIMLVSTLKWDIAATTPLDVLVQLINRLPISATVRSRLRGTAYIALTRFASRLEYLRHTPTMVAACSLMMAIDVVHSGAEATDDEAGFMLVNSDRYDCAGCSLLEVGNHSHLCSFDDFYFAALQIVCDLLHLTKEQISECKCALRNSMFSEVEYDQYDDFSASYGADEVSSQCDNEEPTRDSSPESLSETRDHHHVVMQQDEDSLLSQSDVEMANLAELNNNEPEAHNKQLLGVKSLDDSGFITDLSPSNSSRKFASTPTGCGGVHLLAF